MQTLIMLAVKQLGMWLLSSTFRQTIKVVKKWVAVAETQNGIDKKAFAWKYIQAELKEAGIEIAKGIASEATAGAQTITANQVNYLIEKYALRFP